MRRLLTALVTMLITTPVAGQQTITMSDLSAKQIVTMSIAEAIFTEAPVLVKIAFCESSLEHTDFDGSAKQGKVDPRDTGLMQINKRWHLADAQKLGLDITNFYDNMTYALFLFDTQGVKPWNASKKCWSELILPTFSTY